MSTSPTDAVAAEQQVFYLGRSLRTWGRWGADDEKGTLVLVRTGSLTRVQGAEWDAFHAEPLPGLHWSTARWFADHQVAAVACDNTGVEAPSTVPTLRNPFHMIALRDMGLPLGEFWNLEDLAADCAGRGR